MPCVTWPAALAGPPGAGPAPPVGGRNRGERGVPGPASRPRPAPGTALRRRPAGPRQAPP